ncbi:MAG: aldehyde dehydrogenase family protein, partial [Eubacteriales bacterium]|nr:aldehyde dehydrogenase family protein [Eubacteriales bacterium]
MQMLKPLINGQFIDSKSEKFNKIFDPSTGEQIAQVPTCTKEEVETAIAAAKAAFPAWSNTPLRKRCQLMFKLRELIVRDMDELTLCCATENGKTLSEAAGDVGKALEMTELAAGALNQLMGDSLRDTSSGYDTTTYREPIGVFAGIAPWNFPAMIPVGWMAPLCIVCGNTFVLKPASTTPMTSLKFGALYKEAGFPDGVFNIVPCSRNEAEIFLTHPDVKGVSFVGSTSVGLHVYETAAAHGKRVQALCEAKNHALVLKDAPITRTAAGIMNSSFGCAGERCMALPSVVVEEEIADQLVSELVRLCKAQQVGPAYDKASKLGPVGSAGHMKFVTD